MFLLMRSKQEKPSKGGLRDAELGSATRVLRLRDKVKDKHAARLKAQPKEVNFVWNYTQDWGIKPDSAGVTVCLGFWKSAKKL